MRATRALIHLDRLTANIGRLKAHMAGKNPLICFPVKADAYGHGAERCAKAALAANASSLAVATVDEGILLRESGIVAPVLLLSQCLPSEMDAVCEYGLSPFVGDKEAALLLAQAKTRVGEAGRMARLPVFLKIDTGMGRAGCRCEEAAGIAEYIASLPALEYAGTATHFAVSDSMEAHNADYTRAQIAAFKTALADIRARGINTGIVTAANSGAATGYPDAWFDMVRPGIILYGYQERGCRPPLGFEPVMELETRLVALKTVRRGESVSYGRTWTADEDTIIGILPAGYGDGLPRALSGNFAVSIHGALYPLVGRVCMDQCMVNLGRNPAVRRWDAVSVFGGKPPALNAADIACRAGTIPYEITCNINKRVPREYIQGMLS